MNSLEGLLTSAAVGFGIAMIAGGLGIKDFSGDWFEFVLGAIVVITALRVELNS